MKLFIHLVLIFVMLSFSAAAQVKDTIIPANSINDSLIKVLPTSDLYQSVLKTNFFLNSKGTPIALSISLKKQPAKEYLFYLFAGLLLVLGVLKTVFNRYFKNMFRVFFNTSLSQSQLTDQLEQAAIPSLFLNSFFILSAGLYIYVFYEHINNEEFKINWLYFVYCIGAVGACYLLKFIAVLLAGWLTGYIIEAKIYIFSIFLFNKIIGLVLLPFSLLILFSTYKVGDLALIFSLIILGISFVLRFFRVYGQLQKRINFIGFHFFLYMISFEILPIMLIYKTVMVFFAINS